MNFWLNSDMNVLKHFVVVVVIVVVIVVLSTGR